MFEPLPDDEQIAPEPESPLLSKSHTVMAAAALLFFGFGGYAVHEHNIASDLNHKNAAISESLKSTNAQIEQLTAKINELATKPQPAPQPEPMVASAPQAKPAAHRKHASARTRRDDPRWKKVQSQLDEQGKAIASTQQDLTTAKNELGSSIARTHNELVVLQKKGERRYFEFDIEKSKHFNPAGSMNLKLRKSNVKHQYADLDLLVDDRVVTKKHVNLYEPTQFYTGDNDQPMLVVINSITKNHIHGYVAEPKYAKGELATMQQDAEQGAPQNTASAQQPRERQRMSVDNK